LPIAIAVGDPCGIGPDVSAAAALERCREQPIVLFGDGAQLKGLLRARGASTTQCVEMAPDQLLPLQLGELGIADMGALEPALIARHAVCPEAGAAQLRALRSAAQAVIGGRARVLVTGPTSKAAIVSAGQPFRGQTEFLAELDGRAEDDVTMLFLGPTLRVALVTTHLALAAVPGAISAARVQRSVRHLAEALLRLRPAAPPTIAVIGLNPHAGEGGLFGREEIEQIEPALEALRQEAPFRAEQVRLVGPAPAESVFRAAQRGELGGVVAMFHDQAPIASKLLDWGSAVNTTWGLSFVRTSVDHGVAYDAAARGAAEHRGMLAALDLAIDLTRNGHD
jgi:4-hydroxythreonine-4-phosphate dehydrogenase